MANEPAAIRQAQLEDWIEDLEEFDLDSIRDACTEWRRKPKAKRPTPGEVRVICVEVQEERKREKYRAIEYEQYGGKWDHSLYEIWGPAAEGRIKRQQELDAVQERYRRGEAYRAGKLDEYDAIHWPERLADRQRKGIKPAPFTARDLGVRSAPHSPNASYPGKPS